MDPEWEPLTMAAFELWYAHTLAGNGENRDANRDVAFNKFFAQDPKVITDWERLAARAFEAYWKQREALEHKYAWRRH